MENLLEILKYVLPSLIVFVTAYYILYTFLKNQTILQQIKYKEKALDQTLPLRLQAYERISLLIERISPTSMIPRVKVSQMSANELQVALLNNIRQEYEYNLTQQIYVSSQLWNLVTNLKEETVNMIANISANLPEGATANEFGRQIFQSMLNTKGGFPTNKILDVLKEEVKELY